MINRPKDAAGIANSVDRPWSGAVWSGTTLFDQYLPIRKLRIATVRHPMTDVWHSDLTLHRNKIYSVNFRLVHLRQHQTTKCREGKLIAQSKLSSVCFLGAIISKFEQKPYRWNFKTLPESRKTIQHDSWNTYEHNSITRKLPFKNVQVREQKQDLLIYRAQHVSKMSQRGAYDVIVK